MNPIKQRFFFDSEGHIFFELNLYAETTVEKDIADFKQLSERNRNTFDVLELPFGAYQQDFAESNGYRVNVETKELEFTPIPTTPDEPVMFVKPFSEQIMELEATFMYDSMMRDMVIDNTNSQVADLTYQLMMKGVL